MGSVMWSMKLFLVMCLLGLVLCAILGSCARYLPTKRTQSAAAAAAFLPALQDYDQEWYPRTGSDAATGSGGDVVGGSVLVDGPSSSFSGTAMVSIP